MPEILPNSLTREPKIDRSISVPWAGANWFYMFCASCGVEGPRVMETYLPTQYAFYLCQDCADKYGAIADTSMIPDEIFQRKVQQVMVEQYGHILTEPEILRELENASSAVSKLEREGQRRK